eukprot:Skav204786  [mRNA]  locus=scaffold763:217528:221352:+ [translate_table: standard]
MAVACLPQCTAPPCNAPWIAFGLQSSSWGFSSWTTQQAVIDPAVDMWDHWQASTKAVHPLFRSPAVEPGALQALNHALQLGGDLDRYRLQIVQDLEDLVEDWSDHTNTWFETVPQHVATVYKSSLAGCVQVPVLLHLLEQCQYPGVDQLRHDLSYGFDVLGRLPAGTGWLPRLDSKYANPISFEQLGVEPEPLPVDHHGEPIKGLCDMWSAGVVLYLLLVGHNPFNQALKQSSQEAQDQVRRGMCCPTGNVVEGMVEEGEEGEGKEEEGERNEMERVRLQRKKNVKICKDDALGDV